MRMIYIPTQPNRTCDLTYVGSVIGYWAACSPFPPIIGYWRLLKLPPCRRRRRRCRRNCPPGRSLYPSTPPWPWKQPLLHLLCARAARSTPTQILPRDQARHLGRGMDWRRIPRPTPSGASCPGARSRESSPARPRPRNRMLVTLLGLGGGSGWRCSCPAEAPTSGRSARPRWAERCTGMSSRLSPTSQVKKAASSETVRVVTCCFDLKECDTALQAAEVQSTPGAMAFLSLCSPSPSLRPRESRSLNCWIP